MWITRKPFKTEVKKHMISIELILIGSNKRLCMTVDETTKIGDFRRYLRRFFGIKNECILILSEQEKITDEMSLSEAGMYTGSGVVIEDE